MTTVTQTIQPLESEADSDPWCMPQQVLRQTANLRPENFLYYNTEDLLLALQAAFLRIEVTAHTNTKKTEPA